MNPASTFCQLTPNPYLTLLPTLALFLIISLILPKKERASWSLSTCRAVIIEYFFESLIWDRWWSNMAYYNLSLSSRWISHRILSIRTIRMRLRTPLLPLRLFCTSTSVVSLLLTVYIILSAISLICPIELSTILAVAMQLTLNYNCPSIKLYIYFFWSITPFNYV